MAVARCSAVYLTNDAVMVGFTLTNGFSARLSRRRGVLRIHQRRADQLRADRQLGVSDGGGAYGGTLNNCTLTGNSDSGTAAPLTTAC